MDLYFIGDFKKLIPMGFVFQRMFADNYICYHFDTTIWIWRARKDIQISDNHGTEAILLQRLIEHDFYPGAETLAFTVNIDKQKIGPWRTSAEWREDGNRIATIKQNSVQILKTLYENKMLEIR